MKQRDTVAQARSVKIIVKPDCENRTETKPIENGCGDCRLGPLPLLRKMVGRYVQSASRLHITANLECLR